MNKLRKIHGLNNISYFASFIENPNLGLFDKYLLRKLSCRSGCNERLLENRYFNKIEDKCSHEYQNYSQLSTEKDPNCQRVSPLNIQLISEYLHKQIFRSSLEKGPTSDEVQRSISHLRDNGLWNKPTSSCPEVNFNLPEFKGDLIEHFQSIGESQCRYFKLLVNNLISSNIPNLPRLYSFTKGWTKYYENGEIEKIDFPTCSTLVFDIEVCMSEGKQPTLACAVSDRYWYTWCSDTLIEDNQDAGMSLINKLIPLGKNENGKLIIGHNVSFDRLAIKEEYFLENSFKFLDTMSLHIAVSGLVEEQRNIILKNKSSKNKIRLPWMNVGCQNSLKDVYQFYCKKELAKEARDVFIKGSLTDVRENFQDLMFYCAQDVIATHKILKSLFPLFLMRFPHPVTLSGMLEMGTAYLPVCDNWSRYTCSSEQIYKEYNQSLNKELGQLAVDALKLIENEEYKKDLWLWDEDWNLPRSKVRILPGFPMWYRKLCMRSKVRNNIERPQDMSTSLKIVPKLLKLTWNGYPLHYDKYRGWGYLKPNMQTEVSFLSNNDQAYPHSFPFDVLVELTKSLNNNNNSETQPGYDIGIPNVMFYALPHKNGEGFNVGNPLSKDFLPKLEDNTLSSALSNVAQILLKKTKTISYWKNNRDRIMSQTVVFCDKQHLPSTVTNSVEYDPNNNYGAILPQVVTAGTITRRAVEKTWMTASNAYSDRIGSELKAMIKAPPGYHFVGADVDSQELWIASVLGDAYFSGQHGSTAFGWMTLQGSKTEGTDMHSRTAQTAGISRDHAKVINYGRIYGAGMKFMQRLLKQFNPTMSENEAKQKASNLFAATKGQKSWYLNQKGRQLAQELELELGNGPVSRKEIFRLLRLGREIGCHLSREEIVSGPQVWSGGSESYMFNCLESIARLDHPQTPVLGAKITRALEPWCVDDQFLTSRINWVVQSSAVDFLHLMLVCMQWLFSEYKIDGRFCISIHDEVRYLVASKDRYRAALALHITNLLTRSFISMRLGLNDLPQSVAFFSSVDIDKVLRKEPNLDCVTPSNPDGLHQGYNVEPGESLTIQEVLEKTGGKLED